jgi:hypothetical protein
MQTGLARTPWSVLAPCGFCHMAGSVSNSGEDARLIHHKGI